MRIDAMLFHMHNEFACEPLVGALPMNLAEINIDSSCIRGQTLDAFEFLQGRGLDSRWHINVLANHMNVHAHLFRFGSEELTISFFGTVHGFIEARVRIFLSPQ